MKRTILKSVVTVFAVWCSLTAYAYDVCVDGIFYNLDINNKTAEVTYEAKDGVSYYKGDIVIPESFLFGGITFSVTGIGENAFCKMYGDDYSLWFYDNTDLTSVSIPYSVTSIGYGAFADCTSLTNVYCYAKNVPETNSYTFININIGNATLHVPAASLESYQTTSPWSDFGTIVSLPTYRLTYMIDGVVYQSYAIEEGSDIVPEEEPTKEHYTFSGWSEIPATMPNHDVTITGSFTYSPPPKCATPTITLGGNGQIEVECATEGAKCVTTIMTTTTTEDSKIDLNESSATYHISAYATAEGYQDSDVVTTSFKWSKKNGDLNGDNLVNISDVTTLVNMILGR